jgi:DNA-directed RNA polymerase subunit K/omega
MRDIDRTAGLTSQAAVEAIGNRYNLVLVASQRMRELARGALRRVQSRYGDGVTTLLEIEQGKVGIDYLMKAPQVEQRKRSNPR